MMDLEHIVGSRKSSELMKSQENVDCRHEPQSLGLMDEWQNLTHQD